MIPRIRSRFIAAAVAFLWMASQMVGPQRQFDGADPSSSTAVRLPATTPLQALFMLIGVLAHRSAEGLARRRVGYQTTTDRG